MTRKFTLDNMETYFKNYIPCPKHQEYPITNFCLQPSCLKSLCPQCVQLHSKQFDHHHVESIKSCISRASRKLKSAISELQLEVQKIGIRNFKTPEDYIEDTIRNVRALKKQIVEEVNHYFEQQQNIIKTQLRYKNKRFEEYSASLDKMHTAIKELNTLHGNLFTTSMTLQTTKKVSMLDFKSLSEHFRQQNELLKQFSRSQINITIDEIKRKQLKATLTKILEITSKDVPNITKNVSSSTNLNKITKNVQYYDPQHKPVPAQPKNLVLYPTVLNESPSIERGQLEINLANTFTRTPFVHFFESENKTLHILFIQELESTLQTNWKHIPLNIKFDIPTFHKTIGLPKNSIYLIGGSWSDHKINKVFKYDNQTQSLLEVANMSVSRSSHAICNIGDKIYIAGGLTDGGATINKCEVFDSYTLKCYKICDMRYPTTNSSLTAFNQRYILKVGGLLDDYTNCHFIQRYDINNDIWQLIDPTINNLQTQFSLLSTSGSLQINDHQLFIFGGYNQENNNQASDLSFVIDFSDPNDYIIRDINLKPLPIAEGFWNSTPIIHNQKVYSLQNVADPHSNNCLEQRRNVLVFNGKTWKVYA